MTIEVVAASGEGPTELAAFDAAETAIGVGDCNLIRLSSVIPPGAEVVALDGPTTLRPAWGDKLYCIYAERRTSKPGESVWAGVGWFLLEGGDKGLFCEHDGNSREEVEQQIRDSLGSFAKLRGLSLVESDIHMKLSGTTCGDEAACALAMAVYRAEGW